MTSRLEEQINAEYSAAIQLEEGMPENVGIFRIKSANQTISDAMQQPDPCQLFGEFWFENECCCLFADSNIGKSILAVQIAEDIANQGKPVIYFDFELSEKQFEIRYTNTSTGVAHQFPKNFYRCEINTDLLDGNDVTEKIISSVETAANYAKYIIIDNLTWLCNDSEKGDTAGQFMMFLMRIKKEYNLSILVLAHTPKRPLTMPITMNDLAGSRKLANFFDSIFCIGASAQGGDTRYIKQIKVRNCAKQFDGGNVCVYRIEKKDNYLSFVFDCYSDEREHLKVLTSEEMAAVKDNARGLKEKGLSVGEIGKELGVSKSSVQRYITGQ